MYVIHLSKHGDSCVGVFISVRFIFLTTELKPLPFLPNPLVMSNLSVVLLQHPVQQNLLYLSNYNFPFLTFRLYCVPIAK